MNDLQPMVIKVPYTYMPVYNQLNIFMEDWFNQSSKRGSTLFFNLTLL